MDRRVCSALVALVALAACGDGVTAPEVLDPQIDSFAQLVNRHRLEQGCGPLLWNADVAEVAQTHSEDMVTRDFFAHTNPDGASPFDRLTDAGIAYSLGAENIAFGYPDAVSVLRGWLDSPGHRANIENCGLEEHGVGLVGTYWTHLFITAP